MTAAPGRLADLAVLGPYFTVDDHPAGAVAPAPWRAFDELLTDTGVLRERVTAIRHGLAAMGGLPDQAVEMRVAASVTHLGLAARLISPTLALGAGFGIVLNLAPGDTWWQPVPGGAVPVSIGVPQPDHPAPDTASVVELLIARVLDGPIRALGEAFARLSVSPQVLWGNVASAVHGAATMLDRERPEWTVRTQALTAALREREPLAGTGTMDTAGRYRRHSCCLIYRAAPDTSGPVCGDCVLATDRT